MGFPSHSNSSFAIVLEQGVIRLMWPSFFHWAIVFLQVLSLIAIILHTSLTDFLARYKPITSPLSKTEVSFVGFFPTWLFMLLVAESSCSTDCQWDWTQLLLPYFFFFKFAMRELVKKNLHYIYILPGCDKRFGRVAYKRVSLVINNFTIIYHYFLFNNIVKYEHIN